MDDQLTTGREVCRIKTKYIVNLYTYIMYLFMLFDTKYCDKMKRKNTNLLI